MLYYSHVNEDSGIERKLLADGEYQLVVAVAGSGERILALIDNESVKTILAVDINREALFLLELKIAMLVNLTVENYLIFIGHAPAKAGFRIECFQKVRLMLTPTCAQYWERKTTWIEKGILNAGHFETFMSGIRPLLTLFLGKGFKRVLIDSHFRLNNFQELKWKLLAWLFSKKWGYRFFGNEDVAFVGKGAVPGHIPAALAHHLENGSGASSFITHLIFNGHLREMSASDLPPSLQREVLMKIKRRLMNNEIQIEYHQEDLLEFVKKHDGHGAMPTFYSASDILSFENHHYLLELLKHIPDKKGNIVIVRAFLRNRLTLHQLNALAEYNSIQQLDDMESSRMYQVVAIRN